MQFQNRFDIEEFLAYLLPGATFTALVALNGHAEFLALRQNWSSVLPDLTYGFVITLIFLSISMLFGHVFSVISRFVWRKMLHLAFGDPENIIFKENNRLFAKTIRTEIFEKFKFLFGFEPTDNSVKPLVSKLIRSYVLSENNSAADIRQVTVRSRLLCANFLSPIAIAVFFQPSWLDCKITWIAVIVFVLLFVRQHYLDSREARDIYLAFLSAQIDGYRPVQKKKDHVNGK